MRDRFGACFRDDAVPLNLLRQRAHNLRWAEQPDGVIPLTAADPDFPAPAVIREAIVRYGDSGVFSYGPPGGLADLREAVAAYLRRPGAGALGGGSPGAPGSGGTGGPGDPSHPDALPLHPHNPLGRCFRSDELEALARFCLGRGLRVLSDEIWVDVVYPPATAASSPEGLDWLAALLVHLQARRDQAVARLSAINGLRVDSPAATYVLFVGLPLMQESVAELVDRLRLEQGVARVPGSPRWFGPGAAGHVRLSFAAGTRVAPQG